jgi:hypothetical protein
MLRVFRDDVLKAGDGNDVMQVRCKRVQDTPKTLPNFIRIQKLNRSPPATGR